MGRKPLLRSGDGDRDFGVQREEEGDEAEIGLACLTCKGSLRKEGA